MSTSDWGSQTKLCFKTHRCTAPPQLCPPPPLHPPTPRSFHRFLLEHNIELFLKYFLEWTSNNNPQLSQGCTFPPPAKQVLLPRYRTEKNLLILCRSWNTNELLPSFSSQMRNFEFDFFFLKTLKNVRTGGVYPSGAGDRQSKAEVHVVMDTNTGASNINIYSTNRTEGLNVCICRILRSCAGMNWTLWHFHYLFPGFILLDYISKLNIVLLNLLQS